MEKFLSRKLLTTVVGIVAVVVLPSLGLPDEVVARLVELIKTYLIAQGGVDGLQVLAPVLAGLAKPSEPAEAAAVGGPAAEASAGGAEGKKSAGDA